MTRHWHSWACLFCAAAAGAGAYALRVPLAWVLGPLVVTAVFAMSGFQPWAPLAGRRFGQVIVGGAIGLNLTPVVVAGMLVWVPLMVVTALLSMLASALIARGVARYGRIDLKTAYFAMMPGGLSEMANIGREHGAQNEPIALAQALRVAVVVCVLPPLIVSLGIDGGFETLDGVPDLGMLQVVLLITASLLGVAAARLARLNNPWMLGALLGAAVLTATGFFAGHMPRPLFYLGQFLIGIAIGARFRREIVARLLRLSAVCLVAVLALTAVLLAYAVAMSRATGIDVASAALASSAGGFAEMAVTAEVLHLNVALVTGFHVVRAFIVNGFTAHYWTLLQRLGFFGRGTKPPGR